MQPASPSSGTRDPAYRFVEGLHLRQWVLRPVLFVGVLATNGVGLLQLDALPALGAWRPGPEGLAAATWIVGALLVAHASWMRVAAKGVLVRKRELTTHGAYARVRHPFYTASLLGAVGTLVLAGPAGAVLGIAWLLLALPVFVATVRGEEDGLSQLHPESWAAYASRVRRRLLPGWLWPGTPRATLGPVTWTNLRAEREPPRLLRFLAAPLAVAGARHGGAAGWTLVGLAALLIVTSHVVPALQAPSRRTHPKPEPRPSADGGAGRA